MNKNDAYTILAERHGKGDSARYRHILETLMNPFQAELVVALPATADELAAKFKKDVAVIKKEIDGLFNRGVVIPKDFYTKDGARFCRVILQLHDATEADARSDKIYGRKLLNAWEDFCQHEWYPQLAKDWAKLEQPLTRILPSYKAIKDIADISPMDDVRAIIKANSPIAVVPCSCRRQAGHTRTTTETCIQLGRSAEYAVVRGSGKKITAAEAKKLIDKIEAEGQVHTWTNARTLNYGVLCNCTTDACVVFTPLLQYKVPVTKRTAKSRFECLVNQELCDGCQVCIDRCQFDAIDMVQPKGSKKYKAQINAEKCMGCGVCVITCEPKALSMKIVRPVTSIPETRPVPAA